MKIAVAIESYLNIINSAEIGNYIKKELKDDFVRVLPVIDGGMGSVSTLKKMLGGQYQYVNVHNPLNQIVTVRYLLKGDSGIMEMAEPCGIGTIDEEDIDIMNSSSIGLGEMIVDALDKGVRNFLVCIGDSATNDIGMGMLYALGVKFLDKDNKELEPSVINLSKVKDIDISNMDIRLKESKFSLACNINCPLMGKNGCANLHAKRKGATDAEVTMLENLAKDFTSLIEDKYNINMKDHPQAGAGGGASYAMMSFLNADAKNSMDLVINYIDFKSALEGCELLFVGEKVVNFDNSPSIKIAKIAKENNPNCKVVFLTEDFHKGLEKPKEINAVFNLKFCLKNKTKDEEKEYYGRIIADMAREIRGLLG